MRHATILVLAALATLIAIEGRAQQAPADHGSAAAAGAKHDASAQKVVMPDSLKWEDVKSLPPGAKMVVLEGDPTKEGFVAFRIKLPANYRIPPHFHPCPERVTVLSGKVRVTIDGKTKTFERGGFYVNPPNDPHSLVFPEDSVLQLTCEGPWVVTYVK